MLPIISSLISNLAASEALSICLQNVTDMYSSSLVAQKKKKNLPVFSRLCDFHKELVFTIIPLKALLIENQKSVAHAFTCVILFIEFIAEYQAN